jgi:AcrR family transcriptional regulator
MSTREAQKAERRGMILDAARALILEGARGDFSMPQLAAAAGVALVTPYNLFGSKAGILLAIARENIFEPMKEIQQLPCDDLPRFLSDLSSVLARVYHGDRHFYRRLIATLSAQDSAEGIRAVVRLNYERFEPLVERLLARKKLRPVLGKEILAQQFAHMIAAALQHRIITRGSEERLRLEFELGLILIVAGLAPAADRRNLLERARQIGQAIA